jgi:hypothetical protein
MPEIKTEKLGIKIIIDGNIALFDNEEFQLYDAEFDFYGKYAMMDYNNLLNMFNGLNYDGFDVNIIGNDYNEKVKVKTMENNRNKYRTFFADNKLIININASEKVKEMEFNHLITSWDDQFFYIAERILE